VRRPIVNKGHEQGQVKVHQLGLDEVQQSAVAACGNRGLGGSCEEANSQ